MTRIGVGVLFVLAMSSTAAAQAAGPYRLDRGDTLLYGEVTDMRASVHTPQGELTDSTEQDATIGLTAAGTGMAVAWYEALHLRSVGPNGNRVPGTEAALHHPFTLYFPADGRVRAKQVPAFPEAVTAITDLRHEFDDFFVAMPPRKPRVGTTWQDTVGVEGEGATGGTESIRAIRKYRAEGDTVLHGVPAIVVSVSSTLEMQSSTPVQGRSMTIVTRLAGEENGVVLFDWTGGRLLSRSKSGTLTGTLQLEGGPQPVEFSQTMTYTSQIIMERAAGGAR